MFKHEYVHRLFDMKLYITIIKCIYNFIGYCFSFYFKYKLIIIRKKHFVLYYYIIFV